MIAGTTTAMGSDGNGGQYGMPNTATVTTRSLMFGNPHVFANQAFMSQDGLTRPISNDQNGTTLPGYASKNATNAKDQCADIPHTRRESNPPFNGEPSGYTSCIIDIDYLDPWAPPLRQSTM